MELLLDMNNSDYNKPRTNIFEELPDVFQSDVNKSVFETTYNRQLSKTEAERVYGTIGPKNPASARDIQLTEETPHRQAFQLQPMVYSKVATIDHITSYVDILNKLTLLGVDISRLEQWGNADQFNFAPPITIDKFVNYRDYVWYDPTRPNSNPQYVTMQSECAVDTSKYNHKLKELGEFGLERPIIHTSNDNGTNFFTIFEDFTNLFQPGQTFDVINSDTNSGLYTVLTSQYKDGSTIITPVEPIPADDIVSGDISFSSILQELRNTASVSCTGGLGWDVGAWDDYDNNIYWDSLGPYEPILNPWIDTNKWFHKTNVPSNVYNKNQVARSPILEFSSAVELNQWTQVVYTWKHRMDPTKPWIVSPVEPTPVQMNDPDFLDLWVLSSVSDTVAVNLQTLTESTMRATNNAASSPVDLRSLVPAPVMGEIRRFDIVNVEVPVDDSEDFTKQVLVGSGDARVFVDGLQQFGNYTEIADVNNQFIIAVEFFDEVSQFSVVEVELYPAASVDVGREKIAVRTIESDSDWEQFLNDQPVPGTPPLLSITRYHRVIQTKDINEIKYPLFDIFNVDGTTANLALPIFKYTESAEYPIVKHLQMRAVVEPINDYMFEQTLLTEDNGPIYCYVDTSTINSGNPQGLQTIWRIGSQQYVPKFVDGQRHVDGEQYTNKEGDVVTAQVDAGNGFWEIPNQLYFNPLHENRKKVSYLEMYEHFKSNLALQQAPIGFAATPKQAAIILSNSEYDYGVGGTIKEFNDSYDSFVSTLHIDNTTPVAVIEFAKTEYERALSSIKEEFRSLIYSFMLSDSPESMVGLDALIADFLISRYETNDSAGVVFGDSNTYNAATNQGIKGWPATLPFVMMAVRSLPVKLVDLELSIFQLRHHDGHLSTVTLTHNSIQTLMYSINNTVINDQGRLRGWDETKGQSGMADGGVVTTRTSIDWNRLLPNDYWLDTSGLYYRFEVVAISATQPTNSSSVPPGGYWLRSLDGMLMVKDQTVAGWSPANGTPNDVSDAWRVINFNDMLLNVLLEVETRLYQVAPTQSQSDVVFGQDQYILNDQDQVTYERNQELMFLEYTKRARIADVYSTDYNATDPFTWNYSDVTTAYSPYGLSVSDRWAPRWHTINQNCFNTPYPHLEPWKLQGFFEKPDWWDSLYKSPTPDRRWTSTMWTNILAGVVPSPHVAPAGIHGYSFVSVNTTNAATTDGYQPDDLLPPYWIPPTLGANDQAVKNMVFVRTSLNALPGVDFSKGYQFGDQGPIEWRWRQTTEFLYDEMINAFRMQPIRYTHYTLGVDFTLIGGLQVGTELRKVYNHQDVTFHGDLDGNDDTISYAGTLQWYINFNRANSYDSEMSDFRPLWTDWVPHLSYQFGGMVDTRSLDIRSNTYNLLKDDFEVIVKRSPNITDQWLDALTVTVGQFGKSRTRGGFKVPYGNASDWKFIIDTPAITTRTIQYYTARNYIFTIVDSQNGLLECNFPLPWVTGDAVQLTTSLQLPQPLSEMQSYYFVTGPTATTFYLADTKAEAQSQVVFTYEDQFQAGEHRITQLKNTFTTTGNAGGAIWRHHTLNTNEVKVVDFPYTITGAQQVIDFIDGYSRLLQDRGFVFNSSDYAEIDPQTGRVVNWQLESEKMLDVIYTGLGINNTPGEYQGKTYQFVADILTDNLVIPDLSVPYADGQEVFLFSTGVLPTPLLLNTAYYIIRVANQRNQFKLARTKEEALAQISVDVKGNGTGSQFIGSFQNSQALSSSRHHVNPFRHNVWFVTENGVVSNMVDGPYSDIKSDQTIFDQYGRPFSSGDIQVLREDKITRLVVRDNIPNDITTSRANDTINTLTIGGMHIFVDGYEHVVKFNDYTTASNLIYDPFFGLNVARLLIDVQSQRSKSQRPVMGGYVLNEGGEMIRNIEGSIEDAQMYYDAFADNEHTQFIDYARHSIGYSDLPYLDQLGVTDKSKFLFWKGMIQAKGSTSAVKAFVNSVQFIDAQVDEYWAYKIAEFGDNREVTFPEVKMNVNDARRDDIKYQFTDGSTSVEIGFEEIAANDDSRWVNFPTVTQYLADRQISTLNFESKVSSKTSYRFQVGVFEKYDTVTGAWIQVGTAADPYIVLESPCDYVDLLVTSGVVEEEVPFSYTLINSNVIQISTGYDITFDIYTKIPNYDSLDPSHIIDNGSGTTVSTVMMWDPARGRHYSIPYSVFDFVSSVDPVKSNNNKSGWTQNYVGKTWLDTSMLAYKPYYDRTIFPTVREQLFNWGKLTDWSGLIAYEWVKSPVPPDQYQQYAIDEPLLAELNKVNGAPVRRLQKGDLGSPNVFEFVDEYQEFHVDWWAVKPQPTLVWPSTAWVTMYVNGARFGDQLTPNIFGFTANTFQMSDLDQLYSSDLNQFYLTVTGSALDITDRVHLVRELTTVEYDAGEYQYDYDYITSQEISSNGVDVLNYYYFWVESRNTKSDTKLMSIKEAQNQLIVPDVPYQFTRKSTDQFFDVDSYDQLIIREMGNIITTENRYTLQLTRNFTLRDTVNDKTLNNPAMLKNVHQEWATFRRQEPHHPPYELWVKATEAVVGYDLLALEDDQLLPVPSLDRVLYDNKYGTTTRFGLSPGLAMLDPTLAVNTVLTVINRSSFDCLPIDKYDFLDAHDMTTPQGRKLVMDDIYNTFPSRAVNDIMFELIHDAYTLKSEYPDLFKTSWVAVHGVKLLESKGTMSGF